MHPDQQYIHALKYHDAKLIDAIYRNFAPGIRRYLVARGADAEEAGDIFQEALIDIYKRASDDSFELSCPFEAFLLLVCKRKWINAAEKKQRSGVTKSLDEGYHHVADTIDSAAVSASEQLDRESLVMKMLQQISSRCREIIMASYTQKSQQELAGQLGVSYAYLRKKKSVCMATLIEMVRKNTIKGDGKF
ncbi:hypothetical protein GCM10027051_02930 [Niabella terrae]